MTAMYAKKGRPCFATFRIQFRLVLPIRAARVYRFGPMSGPLVIHPLPMSFRCHAPPSDARPLVIHPLPMSFRCHAPLPSCRGYQAALKSAPTAAIAWPGMDLWRFERVRAALTEARKGGWTGRWNSPRVAPCRTRPAPTDRRASARSATLSQRTRCCHLQGKQKQRQAAKQCSSHRIDSDFNCSRCHQAHVVSYQDIRIN